MSRAMACCKLRDAMSCVKCGHEVVAQAKFCGHCGYRVAVECPSCGILNPTEGLFCYDCGWSLTASKAEPSEPAPSAPSQPAPGGSGCPRCGSTNEPGSVYCYHCGLPLEEENQAENGAATEHAEYTHPYKSPRTRANWTVGLLIVTCIMYALQIAYTYELLTLIEEVGIPLERIYDAVETTARLWVLILLVYIPTAVAFLMWMHRASRNLRALGAHGQRFSPGWAVGWWFVPIMFFFLPYQAMAEIWRGSDPNQVEEDDLGWFDWRDRSVSSLLGWWWGLWIVSDLLGLATRGFGADIVPTSTDLTWMLIGDALTIAAGVLAILVVRRITDRQDEKMRRVATG